MDARRHAASRRTGCREWLRCAESSDSHGVEVPGGCGEVMGGKNMANPILVTGAAGRVGGIGRTVTELLLKQGKAVRAMV